MISQLVLSLLCSHKTQHSQLPVLRQPTSFPPFFSSNSTPPLLLLLLPALQFRNSQARPQAQFLANFSAEFPNDLCAACFSWLPTAFPRPYPYPLARALFHLCICFQINSPSISHRGFAARTTICFLPLDSTRLHRNLFAQLCGSRSGRNENNNWKLNSALDWWERGGQKRAEEWSK